MHFGIGVYVEHRLKPECQYLHLANSAQPQAKEQYSKYAIHIIVQSFKVHIMGVIVSSPREDRPSQNLASSLLLLHHHDGLARRGGI
jgi:hypothetical protein